MISIKPATVLLATIALSLMSNEAAAAEQPAARALESDPDAFCWNFGTNCRGCLTEGCRFDGTRCIPDCRRAPADGACYSPNTWPDLSILGTCRRAKTIHAPPPHDTCASFGTNCRGCLEEGCRFDGSNNKCVQDCTQAAADGACYSPNTWPELSILGTCRRAKSMHGNRRASVVEQDRPIGNIRGSGPKKEEPSP